MIKLNKEEHRYFDGDKEYVSVSKVIQDQRLADFSMVEKVVLEASQDFGTAVHRACELYDRNELDEAKLDEALLPYLFGWKKFLSDHKAEILAIEEIVYSNIWQVAGTLDRVVLVPQFKGYILIDLKTSASIYPATGIQTAGYKELWEEHSDIKIMQRWAIQLTAGNYKINKLKEPTDRSIFLSAVSLYNWRKKHKLIRS